MVGAARAEACNARRQHPPGEPDVYGTETCAFVQTCRGRRVVRRDDQSAGGGSVDGSATCRPVLRAANDVLAVGAREWLPRCRRVLRRAATQRHVVRPARVFIDEHALSCTDATARARMARL